MRVEEFYRFIRAREQIRLNRETGMPWPWTDDEILQSFKFTNVKRAHDRTTRELITLYEAHHDATPEVKLLNCAVNRYFGTFEFAHAHGWLSSFNDDDRAHLAILAEERRDNHLPVFTGAYIVTSGGMSGAKSDTVIREYLAPLWEQSDRLVDIAMEAQSWRDLIAAMRSVPGFAGSGFMAKETVLDLAFCEFWKTSDGLPQDKNKWCPVGPGGRRGIARVLGLGPHGRQVDDEQCQDVLQELFEHRLKWWPPSWVELELHDIQFQLCEFDKYERARLGEGRPKNRYRPE